MSNEEKILTIQQKHGLSLTDIASKLFADRLHPLQALLYFKKTNRHQTVNEAIIIDRLLGKNCVTIADLSRFYGVSLYMSKDYIAVMKDADVVDTIAYSDEPLDMLGEHLDKLL